jgi:hypothetical protein
LESSHVNLTYISQTGGTGDAGDQYTGLDRFGPIPKINPPDRTFVHASKLRLQ